MDALAFKPRSGALGALEHEESYETPYFNMILKSWTGQSGLAT